MSYERSAGAQIAPQPPPKIESALGGLREKAQELDAVCARIISITDRTVGSRPHGINESAAKPASSGHIAQLSEISDRVGHVLNVIRTNLEELESAL